MGAEQFSTRSSGKTAAEAFSRAVDEARYMHGHGGYSGTIAEKTKFKVVSTGGLDPKTFIEECFDNDNHFCQDKWGAAACIDLGPSATVPGENIFCFFGWASS